MLVIVQKMNMIYSLLAIKGRENIDSILYRKTPKAFCDRLLQTITCTWHGLRLAIDNMDAPINKV
jgi:hypothetical protein